MMKGSSFLTVAFLWLAILGLMDGVAARIRPLYRPQEQEYDETEFESYNRERTRGSRSLSGSMGMMSYTVYSEKHGDKFAYKYGDDDDDDDNAENIPTFSPVKCDGTLQTQTTSVLVNVIGDPNAFDKAQRKQMELVFQDTYNKLVQALLCDSIQEIVEIRLGFQQTRRHLAFSVSGSSGVSFGFIYNTVFQCNGCSNGASLFNNDASRRLLPAVDPKQSRELQTAPPCEPCPLPTDEIFLLNFNSEISKLQFQGLLPAIASIETVSELEEVPCEADLQVLNTSLAVEFTGNPNNITQEELDIIANTVKDTFNYLNGLNGENCDLLFRVVLSAEPDLQGTRRQLQGNSNFGFLKSFLLFFRIIFQCQGCPSGTGLFSNDAGRRQLGIARRFLQAIEGQCQCAIGSQNFTGPTRAEFENVLNQTITTLIQQGRLPSITSFDDVAEVVEVPCSDNVEERETTADIGFVGDPNAALADNAILEEIFLSAYVELSRERCDEFFRNITSVELVGVNPTDSMRKLQSLAFNFSSFFARFRLVFSCRGCPKGTSIFTNDAGRRLQKILVSARSAFVDSEQCFCDVGTIENTDAPTEEEFSNTYSRNVISRNLTYIEQVTDVVEPDPTSAPTTLAPITPIPTTEAPATFVPTTARPVTLAPTTARSVTLAPTTVQPVTPAPTTAQPVTPAPTTVQPVTPEPTTAQPITLEPMTVQPISPEPITAQPVTPQPTKAPVTPEPTTSSPVDPTVPPVTAPPSVFPGTNERQICFLDSNTNQVVCECRRGYTGPSCLQDKDECAAEPNPCNFPGGYCVNRFPADGYYFCGCKMGWVNGEMATDHDGISSCQDINECEDAPCDPNADCINEEPGFQCRCKEGFEGDGFICSALVLATISPTPSPTRPKTCADEPNICNKRANSYCNTNLAMPACVCKPGYFSPNQSGPCQDANECLNGNNNNCHRNADCFNTVGSYYCECKDGYVDVSSLDPPGTNCAQFNECLSSSTNTCTDMEVCIDKTPPQKFICVEKTPAPTTKPTPEPTMCRVLNETCSKAPCCGGLTCNDGNQTCFQCLDTDSIQECSENFDCCGHYSNPVSAACVTSDECPPYYCTSCSDIGGQCFSDEDCCEYYASGDVLCYAGICKSCSYEMEFCNNQADCCAYYEEDGFCDECVNCTGGLCVESP